MRQRETSQRYVIENTVKTLYHPTAEEVISAVKTVDAGVGRATVFRNLNTLTEEGKLVKVCFAGEPTRYDTNAAPHDHFVCRKCGKITDMPSKIKPCFPEESDVDFYTTTYYGLCSECKKQKNMR